MSENGNEIKAIIFDCFGVLITDPLDTVLAELGLSEYEKEGIMRLVAVANRGKIPSVIYRKALANKLGVSFEEYVNKTKNSETKNTELLAYIYELKKKFKVGMLSNVSSKDSLTSRFTKEELTNNFDVVIASGEIGYAKPQAQAYEIAASELGVLLDECVMIDDRYDYCQGALGVGMQTIQYQTFEQLKLELEKLIG